MPSPVCNYVAILQAALQKHPWLSSKCDGLWLLITPEMYVSQ